MAITRVGLVGGIALSIVFAYASLGSSQGTDPWIGTWRLNLAKSTFSPGPPPRSNTLKIEAVAGGAQKHTFDGVNAQGQPTHSERVGKFDGADVRVQAVQPPSQTMTTNAFRRLDSRSFEVANKSDGKLTTTVRVVISTDGKALTQTTTGTDAQGQKVNNTQIYDKE